MRVEDIFQCHTNENRESYFSDTPVKVEEAVSMTPGYFSDTGEISIISFLHTRSLLRNYMYLKDKDQAGEFIRMSMKCSCGVSMSFYK